MLSRSRLLAGTIAITIALLSACQPADVKAHLASVHGVELTDAQAAAIAHHLTRPRGGSVEQMIRDRWAGTGHADRAVRIAKCESGLNPRAKNSRSSASGVFQLIRAHWGGKFDPFDARANIDGAFRLWKSSGWGPWVCRG